MATLSDEKEFSAGQARICLTFTQVQIAKAYKIAQFLYYSTVFLDDEKSRTWLPIPFSHSPANCDHINMRLARLEILSGASL